MYHESRLVYMGRLATTGGFLATFFPGGIYDFSAFFFHYAGYDGTNQALVEHEWKNASCNRGGNHGDIATVNVGVLPPFTSSLCV